MQKNTRTARRVASAARRADAIEARFGRRQPRPAPRRQGTRKAAVAAAIKEG